MARSSDHKEIILFNGRTVTNNIFRVTATNLYVLSESDNKQILALPISKITSVERKSRMKKHKIVINTKDNRYKFMLHKHASQTVKHLLDHQISLEKEGKNFFIPTDTYTIPFEDISLGEVIGKGASGIIYKGKWLKKDVAIKKICVCFTKEDRQLFRRELDCLLALRHPSCIRFYGVAYDKEENPYLVMEYMSKGTLMQAFRAKRKELCNWEHLLTISYDIARGMKFLHDLNIVHRDLKPDNIMISSWEPSDDPNESTIKIVDFGVSRFLMPNRDPASTFCGSVGYIAPEVFEEKYDNRIDVFSFGVIMYLLVFKKRPFPGDNSWDYEAAMKLKQKPVFPTQIPSLLETLLQRCLSFNIDERPSFHDISVTLDQCIQIYRAESHSVNSQNQQQYAQYAQYSQYSSQDDSHLSTKHQTPQSSQHRPHYDHHHNDRHSGHHHDHEHHHHHEHHEHHSSSRPSVHGNNNNNNSFHSKQHYEEHKRQSMHQQYGYDSPRRHSHPPGPHAQPQYPPQQPYNHQHGPAPTHGMPPPYSTYTPPYSPYPGNNSYPVNYVPSQPNMYPYSYPQQQMYPPYPSGAQPPLPPYGQQYPSVPH